MLYVWFKKCCFLNEFSTGENTHTHTPSLEEFSNKWNAMVENLLSTVQNSLFPYTSQPLIPFIDFTGQNILPCFPVSLICL